MGQGGQVEQLLPEPNPRDSVHTACIHSILAIVPPETAYHMCPHQSKVLLLLGRFPPRAFFWLCRARRNGCLGPRL